MTLKPARKLLTAIALTASVISTVGTGRADDAASLDPAALDATWRAAPVAVVDATFLFRLPAMAGEPAWHKLSFGLENGAVLELCALRGTIEARVLLEDLWIAVGPIGNDSPSGPCVLVSGQRVLVANSVDQQTTGRATPK